VTRQELLLMGAAAVAAAALGGFATGAAGPRDGSCSRPSEAARPLHLESAEDRAHLREDLDDIQAAADAFAAAVAKRPVVTDSVDAVAGAKTAPARARRWCEETLRSELLRTHGLDKNDLAMGE
jgi:hypothetical protein